MSLTPAEREAMAGRLGGLAHAVRLAVYTRADGCDTCADTRVIIDDVAALSPHLSVELRDLDQPGVSSGVDHAPAIVVLREVAGIFTDLGVRLVGAPIQHELTSLADAILTVGSGDPGLGADSLRRLATLTRPVHIQVFSTPTCVYCPRAVSLAHRLAVASPLVSATAYSVIEFPDLIRRYRVTGVPKIVVDTGVELLGAQPEAVLVDALFHPSSAAS
ncbi:MAG: thioredoxin family protein [Vicinamibacteraceae bacterium]